MGKGAGWGNPAHPKTFEPGSRSTCEDEFHFNSYMRRITICSPAQEKRGERAIMGRAYRNKRGNKVQVRPSWSASHCIIMEETQRQGWKDASYFYPTEWRAQAELDRRAMKYGWTPIIEKEEAIK